ncbi:serine/threonine protein kinase [Moorella thermoacetica Y72]|uniref:Serine/threonine protein kinase n=1 Tax=Moorella thermoacetica Y72 TaxID=1325331 RepID=A0A0S6U766_NEOTH|nr:serine/threonine protein kinase [Moorella thermoacetica Y72]
MAGLNGFLNTDVAAHHARAVIGRILIPLARVRAGTTDAPATHHTVAGAMSTAKTGSETWTNAIFFPIFLHLLDVLLHQVTLLFGQLAALHILVDDLLTQLGDLLVEGVYVRLLLVRHGCKGRRRQHHQH